MKYEGKRPSKASDEHMVYNFSIGKEELEILLAVVQRSYEVTPRTTQNHVYQSRLRNITKELGKVWVEVIKGRKLPTIHHENYYKIIKKNL